MGMFDTVIVICPNCGEEVGFQSKSGECTSQVYILEDCPDNVLSNVNRHAPYKCDCGVSFDVDIKHKRSRIAKEDQNG